jgi:hypothetical protein
MVIKTLLVTIFIQSFWLLTYSQNEQVLGLSKKIDGLFVFTECEPSGEYDILDEITVTSIPPSQVGKPPINYLDVRDLYIRTAKKINPDIDAIIFKINKSGVSSATLITFTNNSISNDTSIVESNRGLYCFVDSRPIISYKDLGPVINKLNLYNVPYKIAREGFLKRCIKQFPKSEGVIFEFKYNTPNTADAVRFL